MTKLPEDRDRPRQGRGAVGNPVGRFERRDVEPFDDGWSTLDQEAAERPALKTEVFEANARAIVATNDSPDIPFDRSINPYKGCEHGCIYCFARPSHSYLDLSPGLDFESKIFVKPNASELLESYLRKPGYRPSAIALGSNTDPYQPVERKLGITRRLLETLAEFRHPFSIVTKSYTVVRDLDILAPLARQNLTAVFVSITTLDRHLASVMEPRASTPARRLQALRELSTAGVPCGVMYSPVIPGINDHELESVLEAAAEAGARRASWLLVRLPWELQGLFSEWLTTHFPERAEKVLSKIRDMRGGKLNDPRFGKRHRGQGEDAALLAQRFSIARRRFGLDGDRIQLDTSLFRVPPRAGDQASLFD